MQSYFDRNVRGACVPRNICNRLFEQQEEMAPPIGQDGHCVSGSFRRRRK